MSIPRVLILFWVVIHYLHYWDPKRWHHSGSGLTSKQEQLRGGSTFVKNSTNMMPLLVDGEYHHTKHLLKVTYILFWNYLYHYYQYYFWWIDKWRKKIVFLSFLIGLKFLHWKCTLEDLINWSRPKDGHQRWWKDMQFASNFCYLLLNPLGNILMYHNVV